MSKITELALTRARGIAVKHGDEGTPPATRLNRRRSVALFQWMNFYTNLFTS